MSAIGRFAARRKFIFTQRRLEQLQPEPKQFLSWDAALPGLCLRVSPAGGKSFVAVGPKGRGGKMVWITLGTHPVMAVEAARKAARAALTVLAGGDHPRELEATRRRAAERERQNSFAAVAEQYLQLHVSRLRSRKNIESTIRKKLVARWGDRPLGSIERRDVIAMLDALRSEPFAARSALTAAGSLFSWALDRDLIAHSPAAGIKVQRLLGTLASRDRVLTDEEIQRIWPATYEIGGVGGTIVRLLLLTGQRRCEISDLRWSEIDFAKAEIRFPAERMKAGKPHVLPLAPAAAAELAQLPRRGECVFMSGARDVSYASFSKLKARLDRLIGEPVPTPWVFHDLRRTCRSRLAQLGVDPVVAERILAHEQGGIAKVYNRFTYELPMRQALERWEQHLFIQVLGQEPPNVVALPTR
jgi:integrase